MMKTQGKATESNAVLVKTVREALFQEKFERRHEQNEIASSAELCRMKVPSKGSGYAKVLRPSV